MPPKKHGRKEKVILQSDLVGIRMPLHEKMQPIFRTFSAILPDLIAINPKQIYPADYWTPLKLYCLASYIHTCYVPIISHKVTRNFYFIDLMASSGLDRIGKPEENINMVGSTLLASSANPAFKTIYFIDNGDEEIDALNKRLNLIKEKIFPTITYEGIPGNCNDKIDTVLEKIRNVRSDDGKFHILAFADNEGLDIEWKTIEKLLKLKYCDMIINFPTSNLKRASNQPKEYKTERLDAFFGCEIKKRRSDPDTWLDFYINQIREAKPNTDVNTIRVNTGIAYHYDLIIVAKKGEYWDYINSLKNEIERNDAETMKQIIAIILGKQSVL